MNRMSGGGLLAGLLLGSAVVACGGVAHGQDASAPAAQPIEAADLPSVEEIMRLHLEGLGGEEAVRAVTSRRFTGRIRVFAQGQEEPLQEGRLEMIAEAPATMVQEMVFPGRGTLRTFVHDGVVWQLNDQDEATRVDEASSVRQLASARFYQLADWEEMFAEVSVRGGVSQGDRRAVQLDVTHLDGREEVYTIDLDTGMVLMISGERPSPVDASQTVPFRRGYEDYREIEGVKYPYRVLEQAGPIVFEIEISEVEVGVDVPDLEVPAFEDADAAE